jgi:hypothetical protein
MPPVLPGLEEAVERVAFDRLKLSQWHTPLPLAMRFAAWTGFWRMTRASDGVVHICEPSAGGGALLRGIDAIAARRAIQGAPVRTLVDAIELDLQWCTKLRALRPELASIVQHGALSIENADYLARTRPLFEYDLTMMNPPYEGGLDGDFIVKAMSESLRVAGLVRTVALNGAKRFRDLWGRVSDGDEELAEIFHAELERAIEIPDGWRLRKLAVIGSRPDFGGENGAACDFCLVLLVRRGVDAELPTRVTWWAT